MALGRKTGGRKKGTPNRGVNKKPHKMPPPEGMTPLEYLLGVMRSEDDKVSLDHRLSAAKAAAPYMHRALKSVEHSGDGGGPIEYEVTLAFD
jgi:hypothetical protein